MDLLLVCFVIFCFVMAFIMARAESTAVSRATEVGRAHIKALSTTRRQSLVADRYGLVDSKKWEKELRYFITNVVKTKLSWLERDALERRGPYKRLKIALEAMLNDFDKTQPHLDPSATPIEYEAFCAQLLELAGWKTTLTKATGDQGADIIAEKRGKKLVVQCKFYSQPVGNKAVQEVSAAKQFVCADLAAVASNMGFTKSAKELASANGVLLLHHNELSDIR
jgi:restriction system protein